MYDKLLARRLYKSGNMPYWAYIQLYATPEEAIEIAEERRKELINTAYSQKISSQQEKEIEEQVEKAISKSLSTVLKDYKQ